MKMYRWAEERKDRTGSEDMDPTEYSEWREKVDYEVIEAIDLYGAYLNGQTSGFSDALSLPAVKVMFEIEEIPQERRRNLTRMMNRIHSVIVDIHKAKNG